MPGAGFVRRDGPSVNQREKSIPAHEQRVGTQNQLIDYNCLPKKWPHGGNIQIVAWLQCCVTTLKLTGTDGQAGRQIDRQDHVLSQADTLTKNVKG